jgi:hypothetical protein
MLGASRFPFKFLSLLFLLNSASKEGYKNKFVGVAVSGSNERETLIYRPKGRLSSLRPPHRVAHHG